MTDNEFVYQLYRAREHHKQRQNELWYDGTNGPAAPMYALLWLQLLGLAETAYFKAISR